MTIFRAYQLGVAGSSFSYFDGENFTLIEARFNQTNQSSIISELGLCGKSAIDTLHITSWDADHCHPNELKSLLHQLRPNRIEKPGYVPQTATAIECNRIIDSYVRPTSIYDQPKTATFIDEAFVHSLEIATPWGSKNVLFGHSFDPTNSNNNSTIKLFRTGKFTVLSLGDVENPRIAEELVDDKMFRQEVDILLLAHHGADNGFTTQRFLEAINPTIAVCSSNYDNQFEHPRLEIRNLLFNQGIDLLTTKTGDVVFVADQFGGYQAINTIANSTEVSSVKRFVSKQHVRRQQDASSALRRRKISNLLLGKSSLL